MINEIREALSGELIPGNHDSITLFGCSEQNGLLEISTRLSEILFRGNSDVQWQLDAIIKEIDLFNKKNSKSLFDKLLNRSTSEVKKYYRVLNQIDEIAVAMKIQQAQLIKDNKILEALGERLNIIVPAIEKKVLNATSVMTSTENNLDVDIQEWNRRLSQRINDVETTKVVALQTNLQMQVMIKNNISLIDALQNAIGITIPLWKNQVLFLLGDEMLSKNYEKAQMVIGKTEKTIDLSRRKLRKKALNASDLDELTENNEKLITSIKELYELEKERNEIANSFSNLLKG